jgi:hypothetical protein
VSRKRSPEWWAEFIAKYRPRHEEKKRKRREELEAWAFGPVNRCSVKGWQLLKPYQAKKREPFASVHPDFRPFAYQKLAEFKRNMMLKKGRNYLTVPENALCWANAARVAKYSNPSIKMIRNWNKYCYWFKRTRRRIRKAYFKRMEKEAQEKQLAELKQRNEGKLRSNQAMGGGLEGV